MEKEIREKLLEMSKTTLVGIIEQKEISINKIKGLENRVWTIERELERLGGNCNAKYYHEDYVNEIKEEMGNISLSSTGTITEKILKNTI